MAAEDQSLCGENWCIKGSPVEDNDRIFPQSEESGQSSRGLRGTCQRRSDQIERPPPSSTDEGRGRSMILPNPEA